VRLKTNYIADSINFRYKARQECSESEGNLGRPRLDGLLPFRFVHQQKCRHVVVLDDILDEGHTMAAIQEKLLEMGAASCRAAVFANKLIDKEKPTKADYVGLDVPNRYVFGYGMDAAGCWRNLGEIYALNNK